MLARTCRVCGKPRTNPERTLCPACTAVLDAMLDEELESMVKDGILETKVDSMGRRMFRLTKKGRLMKKKYGRNKPVIS